VHYDLKCDNVLCQPRGCYGGESGRGNGTGGGGADVGEAEEEDPGFDAVLCDFGESKARPSLLAVAPSRVPTAHSLPAARAAMLPRY
jgi:hypothetical protein